MIGLGKPFRKKSDKQNRKTIENQCQNCACEQKNHQRESKFLSKHSLFRSTSYLGVIKSSLQFDFTFKKMCEQILK